VGNRQVIEPALEVVLYLGRYEPSLWVQRRVSVQFGVGVMKATLWGVFYTGVFFGIGE
jgi:hypothetical protein